MTARRKAIPAPPTVSGLARKHGVSRETIRKLRENGVKLSDDKAVADGLAASKARHTAPPPADGGESYSEARRRRAIADANLAEARARRMTGELVETRIPRGVITQLDHAISMIWKQTPNELTGILDGLSGKRMRDELIRYIDHTLIPRFANQLCAGIAEIDCCFSELEKILPPKDP